jgi:DNA invertase Pin-like site-specific DNA recombinase
MTKRTLELIRVSTESQAGSDRASIPSQRAINRRTAMAYGLTIVRSIEMSDVSGASVLLAPEMRELLALMNDREIHGVVAREFSRLMRPENFSDYALLQAFSDTNTILYLPEGPIDFSSKTGRLMGTIRAAIAGMERTEILERIWSAKEEKRKAGELGQSKIVLPYGVDYDFATRKWGYTADALRVKEGFRLLLSGNTNYNEIARALDMSSRTLNRAFRNPIYTGLRVISEKRDMSQAGKGVAVNGRQADRKKIKRTPDEVIRIKVISDPLISEREFEQAQRIMDLKAKSHWRMNSQTEHHFVYNGFLQCVCGEPVHTQPNSGRRRADYYRCSMKCGEPYMRRDLLDPHLNRIFAKRLTSPTFLRRNVVPAIKKQRGPSPDVDRAQRQIESLDSKRQRVLDAYFDNVISAVERDARVAAIDRERRAFETIASAARPQPDLNLDTLVKTFAPFAEFDLLNREDKRALLNILTPEIVVANYEVKGMLIGSGMVRHTDADGHATSKIWLPLNLKAA